MVQFLLALALIGVGLLAISLRKTYAALSIKELKRRARANDPVAEMLYKAAAYGASLQVLLWAIIVAALGGSFVLMARIAPAPFAFLAIVAVIAYGFMWMPTGRVSSFSVRVGVWLTPAVAWLLQQLHPLIDGLVAVVQRHRPVTLHTGLYEREDLLALIERQKHQTDGRISADTLELLTHSLQFGDKLVRDCMTPRREVRLVRADETIGPMLMKELHDSGFSRFPVYQDDLENIVGTLHLRSLVSLKHTGQLRDIMDKNVYFVHEEHPLEQVLDAFLKTQHHLFIVVNSFEEFVGVITIEDILEQILGCQIVDEFDQYDNLRAVAAHHAKQVHKARHKQGEEVIKDDPAPAPEQTVGSQKHATDDTTEVVQ